MFQADDSTDRIDEARKKTFGTSEAMRARSSPDRSTGTACGRRRRTFSCAPDCSSAEHVAGAPGTSARVNPSVPTIVRTDEFINQPWYGDYERETAALLAGPSEFRTITPQWIKDEPA